MLNTFRRNWFVPLAAGCLLTMAFAVAAEGELQPYTITYEAGLGGILEIDPGDGSELLSLREYVVTIEVVDDEYVIPAITVTAIPIEDDGYKFVKWSDDKENPVRNVQGEAETSDITFTATFEKCTYKLTYNAGEGGKLKVDDGVDNGALYDVYVEHGSPGPIVTAVPNTGYDFVKWSDEITTAERADVAFGNISVTAEFALKTYKLSYTVSSGGKLQVNGEDVTAPYDINNVVHGTKGPAVKAVSNEGYDFVKWSDGITTVERADDAVRNISVTAEFTIKTYKLSYTVSSGGKIRVGDNNSTVESHDVTVDYNTSGPMITAVPDADYKFIRWSDGNSNAVRTDVGVKNNMTFKAYFQKPVVAINDFGELRKIGKDTLYPLNWSYELAKDIDASPSRELNGGLGFEPIGFAYSYTTVLNRDRAFSGKFDGKDKTIKGLYINRPASDSGTGLFGYAYNAEIKNVTVIADSIAGYKYVGALVGRTDSSTALKIEGCNTRGRVAGDSIVGGLAGTVEGSGVTGCYTSAAVSGKHLVGGLAGRNGANGKIIGCYSAGTVTGSGSVAGGLVGYNKYEIQASYSTSAVKGNSQVGGLVGNSSWDNITGGSYNTISQCYSAGAVSGTSETGGFVGINDAGSSDIGKLSVCYWDKEASGQASAGTGAGASVTGKTTAEMVVTGKGAIIDGWDRYGDLWAVSNTYPYLKDLPTYTASFKAVTQGSNIAAGTVSGKTALAQIVNRDVGGAPVAAALVKDEDNVQVGDSLVGWYRGGEKIANGTNSGFNAKMSGAALALSELSGDVDIEARFALKKYTRTYVSVDRVKNGNTYDNIRKAGGKIEIDIYDQTVETADSVSLTREYGTIITVKAVPDPGYRFQRWGNLPEDSIAVRVDTVNGKNGEALLAVFVKTVSILEPGRNLPQIQAEKEAVVMAPAAITAGEFTAGPNPVVRRGGNLPPAVNFYRQGRRIANSELRIYDATGNIINKIKIKDNALNTYAKRIVGSWDLKDSKGRTVSEGTYLLKGALNTRSGEKENVSIIIGVR